MKNKIFIVLLPILAIILMAATIPNSSSFLGNKEKGIGVEVTSGGDIKFLPKSTVGKTYISNQAIFSGTVTIPTTITGMVKATSGVLSAATGGVDYPELAWVDSLRDYMANGLLVHGTLTTTTDSVKFKTTTLAVYTIAGVTYTKAITDNLVFSAANTINTAAGAGDFYGIWLIQINAAGAVSTKAPSANQVYTSSALAIAALPAVDTGNVALGYVVVRSALNKAWVANTSDLLGFDCVSATFSNTQIKVLPYGR